MKKSIAIICPIFSRSGYGQHSRLIVDSLLNHTDKFDIIINPTRWGTTPQISDKEKYAKYIGNVTSQPDISIQIGIPNEFQRFGKVSIGISAVTESSVCSMEFIEGANKMDLVIVPSEFTKKILEETEIEKKDRNTNQTIEVIKCKVPIKVLFEGVDTNVFYKSISSQFKQLSEIKEDFCFLVCGTWLAGLIGEDRKNIGATIQLFLETFKRKGVKNRPALILKVNSAGFSEVEQYEIIEKIRYIQETVGGSLPNVYLLNGDLSDEEMNALYNHPKIKAMISLTHAEGFGIPLLEFTTTGKPVIASNYSGHLDFLSKEHGAVLLPGSMTKIHDSAANRWLIKGSEWFTVNYQFAGQTLNNVFEHYDKYLEKSRKHPKYTKDNFSLAKMEEGLLSIIDAYEKKPITLNLPKLVKL